MAITQTIVTEVRNGSGEAIAVESRIQSGDVEQEFSVTASAAGNVVVPLVVTVADIVAFAIVSTRDVTLTTNDDGTPDETFALEAGKVFAWDADDLTTNPLATNLTSIKFTNAGASDAAIRGVILTA